MMKEKHDFDNDTWMSLLGMLQPMDYVVTIDHFPIWCRHLAWSKRDGDELREYTIQRFSSNMVFSSLLLGSALSILFSSAVIGEEIRVCLKQNDYSSIKYWIGITIIASVVNSISALVATFTAWGMVSAISDQNVHCILRSSIGQYVTQLPSRLVVSSLYLFLFLILLFVIEILSGVLRIVLFSASLAIFFQVVVAFSSFGRLLIHTGAMGEQKIFNQEFERALLPSGLHSALLIKATDQILKRTSAITQYHGKRAQPKDQSKHSNTPHTDTSPTPQRNKYPYPSTSDNLPTEQQQQQQQCLQASSSGEKQRDIRVQSKNKMEQSNHDLAESYHDKNREQRGDIQIHANNNSPKSTAPPQENVDDTIGLANQISAPSNVSLEQNSFSGTSPISAPGDFSKIRRPSVPEEELSQIQKLVQKLDNSVSGTHVFGGFSPKSNWSDEEERPDMDLSLRQSLILNQAGVPPKVQEREWKNESDCRQIYNVPPPPELLHDLPMPSPSLLNSTKRLSALQRLTSNRSAQTTVSERSESNNSLGSKLIYNIWSPNIFKGATGMDGAHTATPYVRPAALYTFKEDKESFSSVNNEYTSFIRSAKAGGTTSYTSV